MDWQFSLSPLKVTLEIPLLSGVCRSWSSTVWWRLWSDVHAWRCERLRIRLVVYGCGESLLIDFLPSFALYPRFIVFSLYRKRRFSLEGLVQVLHLHGFSGLPPELRFTVTSWTLLQFSEVGIWRRSLRGRVVSDSCISDDGSL